MAIESVDILLDQDDDLAIFNGDIQIGDTHQQNVEFILTAQPGHYYQYPLLGYGIRGKISGRYSPVGIKRGIKLALQADGYKILKAEVTRDFEVTVSAEKIR